MTQAVKTPSSKHPFANFSVRFAAGDAIFQESEEGRTMYIVQSGRVRLYREVEGQKRVLGVMEKGDFFGEMSILEGLPRTTSAEALEDCELIEINNTTFDKMIRGNIEIAIRMLRKLSIRLREAERKVAELHPSATRGISAPGPAATDGERAEGAGGAAVRFEVVGSPAVFEIARHETLIGRYDPVTELKPDVDLTELDLKRSVSRRHARVLRADDGWVVCEEVGALNGTWVNGTELVPGQPHPLGEGDRLTLGNVTLVFHAA